MRHSIFLAFMGMSFALAVPQLPPNSCEGCTIGSKCNRREGDLHFSSATYYLADRWAEEFSNSGDMGANTVRAVCDNDWCIFLENLAGGTNGYTVDQANLAASFIKSGAVDGCSNYKQQFIDTGNPDTSNYYLRLNTVSSWYAGLCGLGHITEYYGSRFEGGAGCVGNCANPDLC